MINTFDYMFDPLFEDLKNRNTAKKMEEFVQVFERFEMSRSYDSLFSILWHSAMPCYDVDGVTSTVSFIQTSVCFFQAGAVLFM